MAPPLLLQSKLGLPAARRNHMARSRLLTQLADVSETSLVLVSAPAGFGKTTLLAQWLGSPVEGRSVAWVSLDRRDDDPAVLWSYLTSALNAVLPEVGAQALALLGSPPAPTDAVLASLVDDLHRVPGEVVVVLDDYHVVESPEVQDGVAFLLQHLPRRVHLVLASRADPALPLARLRARGELLEIRAADLRLSEAETGAYLNDVMGLDLAPSDVAVLEARTEGWVAALQLAALSLQGRADPSGFIADFAGDDRFIVDYLAEEVLQRQPTDTRRFLLHTCVLTRLTGPLCDALTGRDDGAATLERLERGNLFVVPLDDQRRWYRYHHLFADVLRARLLSVEPEVVPGLHLRASRWYAEHAEPADAVSHALAGGHVERAADLVEAEVATMGRTRQEATLRRWLEALPRDLVRSRPGLALGYVGALMSTGATDRVEQPLRDVEEWLRTAPAADVQAHRTLPATVEVYRAGLALVVGGDTAGTVRHAGRALELTADDDHLERGAATALCGLAYWTDGDLEPASSWYARGAGHLRAAGHLSDVLGCTLALVDIRVAQGRLDAAERLCAEALAEAGEVSGPPLRGTADLHVALAALSLTRGDTAAAEAQLATGRDLGEAAGLSQYRYRSLATAAALRAADGDPGGAVQLLDDAQRAYIGDYFPDVRPLAAQKARLLVALGDLAGAVAWARERGLTADDDLAYLREYEHLTLARVLLASAAGGDGVAEVAAFVDRLLRAAQDGDRAGSVVEALVLQALVLRREGATAAAVEAVRRAAALAEPAGHVAVFAGSGPAVLALLDTAGQDPAGGAPARRLLGRLAPRPAPPEHERRRPPPGAPPVDPLVEQLVEPLSERELVVLRLLGTDLDGPAIARELVVSLNTVRTHTQHVYAKLGVNSRRAAVRRAEELELLPWQRSAGR